jgi:hypothetical protein
MKTNTNWKARCYGLILLVVIGTIDAGCGAYMAAKQPREKDLGVLSPGTPREYVIAELGAPMWSGERDGNKIDIFTFVQGYSTANRSARAFFHGVSDVFTLGLWEVVATPVEGAFNGTEMKLEVMYDERNQVRLAKSLVGTNGSPQEIAPPAANPESTQEQSE